MTQEQKAKAYDEALARARKVHKYSSDLTEIKRMEDIFPILTESEDEKIRNFITNELACLRATDEKGSDRYEDLTNAIAWLEEQEGCEHIRKEWFEHIKQSWYKEGFIDGKYNGGTSKEWTINDAATLKELIDFLENGTAKLQHDLTRYANWLKIQFTPIEKQGEKKCIDDLTQQEAMDIAVAKCFEQGEQKPADYENATIVPKDFAPKKEPKFHEGDWIVFTRKDDTREVLQVSNIIDGRYYFNHLLQFSWSVKECDEKCHLWTIQDAKDGDMLADEYGIYIFNSCDSLDDKLFICKCAYEYSKNEFEVGRMLCKKADVYPASKDQRDLLFQKMHEAGYMWDSKSKQLLSLKAEPSDIQIPTGWSEEDEKNLAQCIEAIDACYKWDSMIDWLKSLRYRSRWKPSEEQMKALDAVIDAYDGYPEFDLLVSLKNDLKKL